MTPTEAPHRRHYSAIATHTEPMADENVPPLMIRGSAIINSDCTYDLDLLCHVGKIIRIGLGLAAPDNARAIDAKGKMIIPGGIDQLFT